MKGFTAAVRVKINRTVTHCLEYHVWELLSSFPIENRENYNLSKSVRLMENTLKFMQSLLFVQYTSYLALKK